MRFVMRAEEKLTAFLELELSIREMDERRCQIGAGLIKPQITVLIQMFVRLDHVASFIVNANQRPC